MSEYYKKEIEENRKKIEENRKEIEENKNEIERYKIIEKAYYDVMESASWKITKPFRWILRKIKK